MADCLPGESEKKRPAFDKIVLSEYKSSDIDNCILLFLLRQIRFSNLSSFNRQFLPVEMGDFLQNAPFENLQKGMKEDRNQMF